MKKLAILGTVGIPASYGGFETLVDNLVHYANYNISDLELTVYCSGKVKDGLKTYNGAKLKYIDINANGVASIFYDIASLIYAIKNRYDVILLLGVSGALFLPIVRVLSGARIITNVDGVEWKREKWGRAASLFLRVSEWAAVKFSHEIISDNAGISDHVLATYGEKSHVIAYGGDHAILGNAKKYTGSIPSEYCLSLCRIEPENNVKMILEAFSEAPSKNIVFIGNWNSSAFGRSMREIYSQFPNIYILDPIYDVSVLKHIRSNCKFYVHGHSAGGTNPSLVEMMHFGIPIFAFDCVYNVASTHEKASYFKSSDTLKELLLSGMSFADNGKAMKSVAEIEYTWDSIGKKYFDLF